MIANHPMSGVRAAVLSSAMVVVACATANAQSSTVLPRAAAQVEAVNSTSWPFGLSSPTRIQGIYGRSLLAGKPPAIRSLAVRPQGNQSLTGKNGVELEIRLSTSPRDPWTLDPDFAKNVGADERIVFKKRRIDLPGSTLRKSPQAFVVRFPLDNSFTWQQARGGLLVEMRVHSQPAGGYELDASYTECVRHTVIGASCGGFLQMPSGGMAVMKGTSTKCGAQSVAPFIAYALKGGQPGGVAFHMISAQALPAPVQLPLGGCSLLLVPQLSVPLTLDKTGAGSIRYPLHLLHGKKSFYSQFLSLDLGVTSIRSTPALHTRLGGWDALSRVVAVGKVDAPTGFVQPGASWVLELGH